MVRVKVRVMVSYLYVFAFHVAARRLKFLYHIFKNRHRDANLESQGGFRNSKFRKPPLLSGIATGTVSRRRLGDLNLTTKDPQSTQGGHDGHPQIDADGDGGVAVVDVGAAVGERARVDAG